MKRSLYGIIIALLGITTSINAQNDSLLVSTSSTFSTPGSSNTLGQILLSSNPNNRTLQILPQRTVDGHVLNGYVFDVSYTNSGAANGFLFRTGTNNRMIINESGDVGIGTTSPSYKFDVIGTARISQKLKLDAGIDIGASRNVLSSGIGINLASSGVTNIQITHDTWSGSHGILFNAYHSSPNPSGNLATLGNTKYANDVGSHNSGAGAIMYFGNGGKMGFYISPVSTGQDSLVDWSGEKMTIHRNGHVGIGPTSATRKLHVQSSQEGIASDMSDVLIEEEDAQLDILSSSDQAWGSAINLIEGNGSTNQDIWSIARQTTNGTGDSSLRFNYGTTNRHDNPTKFTFMSNGKLGIGTETPGNELEVNGTVRAKEVIVEATGWPDYVFAEDYDLLNLEEVEAYIKANKHLPEIPSAEEVEEEGQQLGEIQQLLLKKIEELTLHTINQEKVIVAQQELLTKQQELINQITSRLEQLESKK